jgi:hypothetical protein
MSAFDPIAKAFVKVPGVSSGTGFGSNPGLRLKGKIFAMWVKGALVVKLPKERVSALVAAGEASQFDPGHGRLMKEWATIHEGDEVALAREAFEFAKRGGKK